MGFGRILLLGYISCWGARLFMDARQHRRYVARWLHLIRKATSFVKPLRYTLRNFASAALRQTLAGSRSKRNQESRSTAVANRRQVLVSVCRSQERLDS